MTDRTLVGFDLETNEKDPEKAEILQIGAVITSTSGWDHKVIFNQKSLPASGVIPEEASKINGIYLEQLQYQPLDHLSSAAFYFLMESIVESGLNPVLVTYNGEAYDLPIFKKYDFTLAIPHIDLYRVVQRVEGLHRHGLKLQAVYEGVIQKQLHGAHGAIPDVKATLDVLRYALDLLGMTIDEMLEWLKTPILLEKCFFGKHEGKLFKDVPAGYLRWVKDNWDNLNPDMHLTLQRYL